MKSASERLHALLVGIDDYGATDPRTGSAYPPLAGCVHDIARVRNYLVEDLALPESRIETLAAPRSETGLAASAPTYGRIVAAFHALAARARPGDSLWIHYSGHGGRTPTAFPELKGPKGRDEALVPADVARADAQFLRDVELGFLLEQLVRRGLFVTLVLDCCHAGGLLREDLPRLPGARARWNDLSTWLRDRPSAVASRADLIRSWRRRAVARPEPRTAQLLDVAGYTAILACRPFERSYEYEVEPGRRGGALTHFLLESLRALGPQVTYRECFEHLLGNVRENLGSFQNPRLEGLADRRLFGADVGAPSRGVTVLSRQAERVLIAAGVVHGVEPGACFEIEPLFPPTETSRTVVEVDDVAGAQCWARMVPGAIEGAPAPEPGDRALHRSLTPRRYTVNFHDPLDTSSWRRLGDALRSQESPRLSWCVRDGADLHVWPDPEETPHVTDRHGEPLEPPLPEIRGLADPGRLLGLLEHVAHFRSVAALTNDDPACPLRQTVHGELIRLRPDFEPGEPCEPVAVLGQPAAVEAGAWIALVLENRFDQPLDLVVLDLTPVWSIEQVHPATGDSCSIDPGERISIPFRAAQAPGSSPGRDLLRIFVTYDPVRFRWLELPALGASPPREDPDRRPRHPLEDQLAAWYPARTRAPVRLRDRFASREWTVFDLVLQVTEPSSLSTRTPVPTKAAGLASIPSRPDQLGPPQGGRPTRRDREMSAELPNESTTTIDEVETGADPSAREPAADSEVPSDEVPTSPALPLAELEQAGEAPGEVDGERTAASPPQPPEDLTTPPNAELVDLRLSLEERIDRLAIAFADKLAYDAHKEQQIERLHAELQEHKMGLLAQATRPLLAGLVRLHDDFGRAAADFAATPREELAPERLVQILAEFQDDVEIVLEENGVTLFREPVERFEPRRQAARKTVETADAERVGQIVRRVRPGFEQDGHLLMKERVEVYVLSPKKQESTAD